MDALLGPLMDDLRACVCGALEGTIGGPVSCFCALMPGQTAPADWCSCKGQNQCGMGWVRLANMFPSGERFPAQDSSTKASCAKVLAAVLEVGVYRCQPVSDRNGVPPDAAAQTQAALVQADDALALHQAIACCEAVTSRPHVLGRWDPRDGGGCGGGAWLLTVQLLRR